MLKRERLFVIVVNCRKRIGLIGVVRDAIVGIIARCATDALATTGFRNFKVI